MRFPTPLSASIVPAKSRAAKSRTPDPGIAKNSGKAKNTRKSKSQASEPRVTGGQPAVAGNANAPVPADPGQTSRLWPSTGAYIVFLSIAGIGCIADLVTKEWVFHEFGAPGASNVWWLIEGYAGIETATNPGALFGLGAGMTPLFALLSVAAAAGLLSWFVWGGATQERWLTVALGCILGGIFGNLYDRLGMYSADWVEGGRLFHVRDWILLCYDKYTWPNFNIADCLLVCGASMLVYHAFFLAKTPHRAESPPKVESAGSDD